MMIGIFRHIPTVCVSVNYREYLMRIKYDYLIAWLFLFLLNRINDLKYCCCLRSLSFSFFIVRTHTYSFLSFVVVEVHSSTFYPLLILLQSILSYTLFFQYILFFQLHVYKVYFLQHL